MIDLENLPTPRFRMVIDISFPEANPIDPSGYEELITRWKAAVESNPAFQSRNVKIREILTIGEPDDYDDWRHNRGTHDASTWPPHGSVTGRNTPDDDQSGK